MTGMKARTFMTISLYIFLTVINVSNKCCREKDLFYVQQLFFPKIVSFVSQCGKIW